MPQNQEKSLITFLQNNPTAVIATADTDSVPHTSIIYYAIDTSNTVFFVTKTSTKKHRILQQNSHVELLVYNASSRSTAQISGQAELISDNTESQKAYAAVLRASMEDSRDYPFSPLSKMNAGEYAAYRITHPSIRRTSYV